MQLNFENGKLWVTGYILGSCMVFSMLDARKYLTTISKPMSMRRLNDDIFILNFVMQNVCGEAHFRTVSKLKSKWIDDV